MATANRQKDFIAEIKTKGIARTNRFTVDFTPPKAMPEQTKRMLLFCEKASLPGINFATTANRSYGETREVVYDRMYDPVTLTFHVDRAMTVKDIFDQWSQHIVNPLDRTVGWYSNYVTPMTIRIQDLEDKTTYLVALYEAYPKSVSAISLDSQNNTDTMRLDVTFQYKYWYASTIQQDPYTKLEKTSGGFQGYLDNFTGFQEKYLKGLGEAGNFVTGAVGQYAMRGFSQVTSRIPAIRF
jgi:hypothetical protein